MDNNGIVVTLFSNIIGVAIIFVWLSTLIMIIIGWILGKIYEKNFYKELIRILIRINNCNFSGTESVRNAYEVYRHHRFGFASKNIIPICQESVSKLRRGVGFDGIDGITQDLLANELEKVIKDLQYEKSFNDEKAMEIIDILNREKDNTIIEQVKQKLIYLEAYHKGVISVKDLEILELKDKMKRKSWLSWIAGIIGIVGSIFSIISFFI